MKYICILFVSKDVLFAQAISVCYIINIKYLKDLKRTSHKFITALAISINLTL